MLFACQAIGLAAPKQSVITISPFLQEVRINDGVATVPFNVTLINNTQQTQSFHLTAVDFKSLDETGGVAFVGVNSQNINNQYSLAHWIKLSTDSFTLLSGQKTTLQAEIINDPSLTPGGHYGAIIASVTSPSSTDNHQVNIKQQLSALILATKVGGAKYDLHLDKVTTSYKWWQLPKEVTLLFNNPGNVHVVPRGLVQLLTPSGSVISQGTINEDSSYVLPGSRRQLTVPLRVVNNPKLWPSWYQLRVQYRYDGYDKFATRTITLHFVNLVSLIPLILIIILLTIIVFWLIRKYRYHPKIK